MNLSNTQIFKFSNFQTLAGICLIVLSISLSSCKKDKINTNAGVSFSTDTLTFDTLFTTLGSTTKFFTIRNTQKEAIKISNIKLAGGSISPYRMNVDGDAGYNFSDIEIPAKDSLYVFVEVTVNPNAANLPFIIEDSIQFLTNGKLQQVQLNAYGQNAHFFNADSIEMNTTWDDNLPYVILNYLQIKQGACLTINAGCDVYFGGGAAMIVEGCLNVLGTDTFNMVTFRGVRLDKDIADRPYDDFPGQYAGLFFLRGSSGNLEFLKLRNSLYGINVGNIKTTDNDAANIALLQGMSIANAPEVSIKNSKIYNNAFYGLFGFFGKIDAENTLVYNCGKNVVGLYVGGDYKFTNCTFYTRGTTYISHTKEPAFYMNNFFAYSTTAAPIFATTAQAYFENCIMYGTLDNEILAEAATDNPTPISLLFKNCDLKTDNTTLPIFQNCKFDDPQFKDVFKSNYKLKSTSPCINTGFPNGLGLDIDGFSRDATPDIGAYEFQ